MGTQFLHPCSCDYGLNDSLMTRHVRDAKPSPLSYMSVRPCLALFTHLDKAQGQATLGEVSQVRVVILKCQVQDTTLWSLPVSVK